jgi:hypothetical protein
MNIKGDLKLVYDSMDRDRVKRVSSFLEGLSLTVTDMGFPGNEEIRVGIYSPNDAVFCLAPVEKRVMYTGFERLGRKYNVEFSRWGQESEECVDGLFVGYRKDPHTGIYMRTGPVIARV